MNYSKFITIAEGKMGANRQSGLRITVSDVLDHMASGMSNEEILARLPRLTEPGFATCLALADRK